MSFLSPLMLVVGALAATVAVALHLLTTRRPPKAVLPTARFVPVNDARAVARSTRPTDPLLLACRLLAALLLGAAFAQPVLDAPGPSVRSVVMLDRSASVADGAAAARAATARLTAGGALVVFDTVAREVPADSARLATAPATSPATTATATAPRAAPGILSAALVAATRAARRVARGADSVRLVLVSPLAEEEFDAATDGLRAEWPGGIELVRVAAVTDTARGGTARLVSALGDDPLAPALARLDAARGAHDVRLVRAAPSAADSAWASAPGRVLVFWPLSGDEAPVADGVTAFGLRTATIVAPMMRLPIGRSAGTATAPSRVIARWRDGSPAATESPLAAGCVRTVGVGLPLAGDLTLRAPFRRFLAAMVEPCGGARGRAVPDSVAQRLAGGTPMAGALAAGASAVGTSSAGTEAVAARRLAAGASADSRLAALLLGLAVAALAAEWLLRRGRSA